MAHLLRPQPPHRSPRRVNAQTVLYFWADWAAPCQQMGQVFAALAEQHPAASFFKVIAARSGQAGRSRRT